MQCDKCRGTGLDPASTPAMNVKCNKCEGGEIKKSFARTEFESWKPVVRNSGEPILNKIKETK